MFTADCFRTLKTNLKNKGQVKIIQNIKLLMSGPKSIDISSKET